MKTLKQIYKELKITQKDVEEDRDQDDLEHIKQMLKKKQKRHVRQKIADKYNFS